MASDRAKVSACKYCTQLHISASTQTPSVDGPDKSVKADTYRFKGSPSSIGAAVINVVSSL